MSEVYFADLRADRPTRSVPKKIAKLFKAAGLADTFHKGDLVAIKSHFGELGSTSFLRPQYISAVVDRVAAKGGKPFLTDCNTLYLGGRANAVDHLTVAAKHGFMPPVVNAPMIIGDGLTGQDHYEIPVDLKHCKTIKVGAVVEHADSIICVSHVKGHMMTSVGAAMKNLGMGFGSRAGKLQMHQNIRPVVKTPSCKACGECVKHCPAGAISIVNKKARISREKCIGCGECYVSCFNKAITAGKWTKPEVLEERIVEYCYGIIKEKGKERMGYISLIIDVTPHCDCVPWSDMPIVPDVGILASKDIVSIDQAAIDLINAQIGLPGSVLKKKMGEGEDKLRELYSVDWKTQLDYAERLGLGERKYELLKVK
jgi:uncharacterized Fe-S center protein